MSTPLETPLFYRVADLRPRLRPHMQVERQHFAGQLAYVVGDPAHNRFHRVSPAANAALSLMDGTRTTAAIWDTLATLGDGRPTQHELIQLLVQLDSADLLAVDGRPDFRLRDHRSGRQAMSRLVRRMASPLAFKIKLIDPDRFVAATAPLVRPLASPLGLLLWLAVIAWGIAGVAEHWAALSHAGTDRLLASDNLLILALTFPVIKLMHELGHAYAAKLNGSEVREAGLMTLVFYPVPYVDVTAVTAVREPWRRALVGAAGMVTELFVAALAVQVWIAAEPGPLRAAAFNTMLIAGVSTLVFNANPLLRFDGYYILGDLLGMPNLAIRAGKWWTWLAGRTLFGLDDEPSPAGSAREAVVFAVYAPASWAYRVTVMGTVALYVANTLHGLGAVLAIWTLFAGLVLPLAKGARWLLFDPALHRRRVQALVVTGGVLAGLAALLFAVPLPYGTIADGVVLAPPATEVRAGTEGTVLTLLAEPGATLAAGDTVLTMADPLLEARVRVLEAQVAEIRLRLAAAQERDRVAVKVLTQQLAYFGSELADARRRRVALAVASPANGRFLVAMPQDLPGRYLRRGELIGYVMDGRAATVRVVVPQDAIEQVQADTRRVEVRFADDLLHPWQSAAIARQVPTATRELPSAALSVPGGGAISVDPADEKHLRAVEMLFQIDLALPDGVVPDRLGGRVFVRLDHGGRSIGWRAARSLRQTFLRRFSL